MKTKKKCPSLFRERVSLNAPVYLTTVPLTGGLSFEFRPASLAEEETYDSNLTPPNTLCELAMQLERGLQEEGTCLERGEKDLGAFHLSDGLRAGGYGSLIGKVTVSGDD